jgi:hypothetical protein
VKVTPGGVYGAVEAATGEKWLGTGPAGHGCVTGAEQAATQGPWPSLIDKRYDDQTNKDNESDPPQHEPHHLFSSTTLGTIFP